MGRMNHTLQHFEDYCVIFDKKTLTNKSLEEIENIWRYINANYLFSSYPISSINSAVKTCDSLPKYAAIRTTLCRWIARPKLYRYRFEGSGYILQQWRQYGIKEPKDYWSRPEVNKNVKLFRKQCQRLINELDKRMDNINNVTVNGSFSVKKCSIGLAVLDHENADKIELDDCILKYVSKDVAGDFVYGWMFNHLNDENNELKQFRGKKYGFVFSNNIWTVYED